MILFFNYSWSQKMVLNKIVNFQKIVDNSNDYIDYYKCHANVKKSSGKETLVTGVITSKNKLNFIVRNCKELKSLPFDTQAYRIIYNGITFNIIDADDFQESNTFISIVAENING